MYINSPGGVITSGMAIYDTMQVRRLTLTHAQRSNLAATDWMLLRSFCRSTSSPRCTRCASARRRAWAHSSWRVGSRDCGDAGSCSFAYPPHLRIFSLGSAACVHPSQAAGEPGQRRCLPHARVMIHQPSGGTQARFAAGLTRRSRAWHPLLRAEAAFLFHPETARHARTRRAKPLIS